MLLLIDKDFLNLNHNKVVLKQVFFALKVSKKRRWKEQAPLKTTIKLKIWVIN